MRSFVFVLWIFVVLSCKAQQQIYPLKTDYTEIPTNSYLKDLNNELDAYVGNWKAIYNGKIVNLYINKEDQKYFKRDTHEFYKDVLSMRYVIIDSNGLILQNTQNINFSPIQLNHSIYSKWVENGNKLLLYYGGTNCGIGWGGITLTKLNSTQLSWEYRPNSTVINSDTCPPGTDKKVYLPVTKDLIFTKQ